MTKQISFTAFLKGDFAAAGNDEHGSWLDYSMRHKADLVKYAMIIVASAPVLAVYPFLQKFFVKGVMIGSVKG